MVKFEVWDEFQEAAKEVYISNPRKTRYTIKHRPVDGIVVVTVTDDTAKVKYHTHRHSDLARIEKLTAAFGMWTSRADLHTMDDLTAHQENLEKAMLAGIDKDSGDGRSALSTGQAGGEAEKSSIGSKRGGGAASAKSRGGKKKRGGRGG